jgi:DNA repair exonuclease SbcCD ATPase subunit
VARALAFGGVFVLLTGAALLVLTPTVGVFGLGPWGAAVLAGAVLSVVGMLQGRAARTRLRSADSTVDRCRVEVTLQERTQAAAQARRDAAVSRCDAADLPANAAALRELARHRGEQAAFLRRDEHWQRQTRQGTAEEVLTVARTLGISPADPAGAVEELARWQRDQQELVRRRVEWRQQAVRLEAVLGGESVADVLTRARVAGERAERLRSQLPPGHVGPVDLDESTVDDLDGHLVRLREEAGDATRAVHVAQVALAEWSAGIGSVGEAEEALARARGEVERLRELATTLDLTTRFLRQAQERAHRTIAPVLADTVRRWLPEATGGRYTEVTVDPEHLRVQVRGPAGRWRDADRLSYGTAEQVYLMLRVALAEHLVRPGTSCPLLLDDVTVHADAQRTEALLGLLRRAAEEDDRQIILFTQQEQVLRWASTLDSSRHAVRTLPPVTLV